MKLYPRYLKDCDLCREPIIAKNGGFDKPNQEKCIACGVHTLNDLKNPDATFCINHKPLTDYKDIEYAARHKQMYSAEAHKTLNLLQNK